MNNEDIDKLNKIVDKYIERQENYKKRYNEFMDKKRYIDILDNIQDNNSECEEWDEEKEMFFDFLYGSASDIVEFEEEIYIRYRDKVIKLYKMHGQGCFLGYNLIEEYKGEGTLIEFGDIMEYYTTKELPMKYKALKTLARAFETLDTAHGRSKTEIDGHKVDLREVHRYITDILRR